MTLYPLASVKKADFMGLCEALWDWEICDQCKNNKLCETTTCSWSRPKILQPFFDFYKNVAIWSMPGIPGSENHAVKNHQDLFGIIRFIRENPDVPRALLTEQYFAPPRYPHKPAAVEQQKAFNVAIQIMDMVDCSMEGQSSDEIESGSGPTFWSGDKTHHEFMEAAFPVNDHPRLREIRSKVKRQLNATQLKKVVGIEFEGTSDLKSHLKYDPNTRVLEIFHHMTFLREYLLATRDASPAFNGTRREPIPRQLALETHDSLRILFPLAHDSGKILQSLASRDGFDFDYPDYGRMEYRWEDEKDISYRYWGTRLLALYDELQEPTPRGISQWVQARTKKRHFMILTIAGIIFAVLTLAIGIFQAWVSYQAWKYPVSTGAH